MGEELLGLIGNTGSEANTRGHSKSRAGSNRRFCFDHLRRAERREHVPKAEAVIAVQPGALKARNVLSGAPFRATVPSASVAALASAPEVAQVNSFANVFRQVGAPLSGHAPPQGGGSYA
jgi:hypothetical protein